MNTYQIVHTNCDCSSDTMARRPNKVIFGPRCPNCRRILGPMCWSVMCTVQARNTWHAMEVWRIEKDIKKQRGHKNGN